MKKARASADARKQCTVVGGAIRRGRVVAAFCRPSSAVIGDSVNPKHFFRRKFAKKGRRSGASCRLRLENYTPPLLSQNIFECAVISSNFLEISSVSASLACLKTGWRPTGSFWRIVASPRSQEIAPNLKETSASSISSLWATLSALTSLEDVMNETMPFYTIFRVRPQGCFWSLVFRMLIQPTIRRLFWLVGYPGLSAPVIDSGTGSPPGHPMPSSLQNL